MNQSRKQLAQHMLAYQRHGGRCGYCGTKVTMDTGSDTSLHVDRMKPINCGGTDDPDNLIAACRKCKRTKNHRDVEKFRDTLRWKSIREKLGPDCPISPRLLDRLVEIEPALKAHRAEVEFWFEKRTSGSNVIRCQFGHRRITEGPKGLNEEAK